MLRKIHAILLLVVSCNSYESGTGKNLAPVAESEDILEYVEHESGSPTTTANLDRYPQNTPPAHSTTPLTNEVNPATASNLTGSIPDASDIKTYTQREAGGIQDGTETVTVHLEHSFAVNTDAASLFCQTLHSYSGLPDTCAVGSNSITRSAIQTGTLRFALSADEQSKRYRSNNLSTKRWAIKQISNTTGNQSTTDDLKGFYAPIGNYLFFYAASPSGGRKIFSINSNDVVDQVTNTRRDQALHDMADGFFSNKTMTLNGRYLMMMENSSNVKKLATIDADRNISYVANVSGSLTTTDGVFPMDENYNSGITQIMNNEYYVRFSPTGASKLYKVKSDFTLAQVSNTFNGSGDGVLYGVTFRGNYYFRCSPAALNQNKLCRTTSDGKIKILTNVRNNLSVGELPIYFAVTEDYLYFTLEAMAGVKKLYRINSDDEVELISNTSGNTAVTDNFFGGTTTNRVYQVLGKCLYFSANNSLGAVKLFKVCNDGIVKQILNSAEDQSVSDNYSRSDMSVATDKFYVIARNPQGGKKLYVVNADDTSQQLSNTVGNQALDDDVGSYFFAFQNEVYFVAKNSSGGRKLHKITSSNKILQVSNISGNQATNDVNLATFMREWNNALYFDGLNSNGALKVFKLYQK